MSLILYLSPIFLLLSPLALKAQLVEEKEQLEPSSALFSFITPPKGWDIADPQYLSKSVQVAFIKKNGSGISPSINLAVEKTNLSLPDYVKVIRQIQESDRRNRWRKLGKVHTSSGIGQLTEIDTTTEFGSIRMLQLILTKHGHAYVITAAALKEEIAQYYSAFQTTFRSLQITSDLISTVPQMERRDFLRERTDQLLASLEAQSLTLDDPSFQKDQWTPFQNTILNNFEDMGAHWQLLMLKQTQEKMLALSSSAHPLPPGEAETELVAQNEEDQPEIALELPTDQSQMIAANSDPLAPDLSLEESDPLSNGISSEMETSLESGQNRSQPL